MFRQAQLVCGMEVGVEGHTWLGHGGLQSRYCSDAQSGPCWLMGVSLGENSTLRTGAQLQYVLHVSGSFLKI